MSNLPALKNDLHKMQGEFGKALPGHITAEKFVRTAQTAIALTRNIEKLKDTGSLLAACSKAASDGLILDGREAALVIDYNGMAQYRPMMRGLLKLAYNSGEIKSLVVEPVRDGDDFDFSPTRSAEPIIHKINMKTERGNVYAYYAQATLRDGGILFEVMTNSEVMAIRDRSDAYKAFKKGLIKSTPWSTDETEMGRKTVFRRLSKYLPSSTDKDRFREAVERIDDDYTFDVDHDAGPATPRPQNTNQKKRGAAAAALKNITPKPSEAKREADVMPEYDEETGEILDMDDYERQPGEDL